MFTEAINFTGTLTIKVTNILKCKLFGKIQLSYLGFMMFQLFSLLNLKGNVRLNNDDDDDDDDDAVCVRATRPELIPISLV